MLHLIILFCAKVLDNLLGTAKTILVQKNKSILAGVALGCSNFIYFLITKSIVTGNGIIPILIVSIASGVGCGLAVALNDRFSHDRTYVNVILSDDLIQMKQLRDFLAQHKITNIAGDSYTLDWGRKTLSITAYAETKADSMLIDEYLSHCDMKFKRLINNERE